jgi:hypothetical protein
MVTKRAVNVRKKGAKYECIDAIYHTLLIYLLTRTFSSYVLRILARIILQQKQLPRSSTARHLRLINLLLILIYHILRHLTSTSQPS